MGRYVSSGMARREGGALVVDDAVADLERDAGSGGDGGGEARVGHRRVSSMLGGHERDAAARLVAFCFVLFCFVFFFFRKQF